MIRKILMVLLFTLVITNNGWSQQVKELKRYNTYQTSLTNDDVARTFANEVNAYLKRHDYFTCYYYVDYVVYQKFGEQNYAWRMSTKEFTYSWGTVYVVSLYTYNASLNVRFSRGNFAVKGQDALQIMTTQYNTNGGHKIRSHITNTMSSMFNECVLVHKMFHFNFYTEQDELALVNAAVEIEMDGN
jgi:hypothetical protein